MSMLPLTPRIVAYLGYEEGIVPEAYLDTGKVWTWAMGVTDAAGVNVLAYKDKPQPLDHCLRASIQLMRDRYLPAVLKAFSGFVLTEAQLAAALAFQWNTGAILTATWVKDFRAGKPTSAKLDILNWASHGTLTARRQRERDLFFDSRWPSIMACPLYQVAKPSYRPIKPGQINILPLLQQIMGAS